MAVVAAGCALAGCSDRGSYTTALNESVHAIEVNYIDTSDSLLRYVTILPGHQALLFPNRQISHLTLLEFKTANGGLSWHNFRHNGPQVDCSGNCRVVYMNNQRVKFFNAHA
jgi:hypothetical protein